ncbi:ChbG/HpnK family deacetylase [Bdellovibrionota bacterium FG-1]
MNRTVAVPRNLSAKSIRRLNRGLGWLALIALLIIVPLYAYKVQLKSDYTDFEVYYRAASRAKQGLWELIYNLGDGASPFRYAPPLLILFRPFAALSLPDARMIWYFLQLLWFALGFMGIHQALRLTRKGHGKGETPTQTFWISVAAFFFILRFCLDCLTIGQSSSLLFMSYCWALYGWMRGRAAWAGSALLIPAVFKIGPGFLYTLFVNHPRPVQRARAILAPLAWLVVATGVLGVWLGSTERLIMLWRGWFEIVLNDSVYYDASHYGSQSIKSALLRAVKWGWLNSDAVSPIYVSSVALGCLAILSFWFFRRARNPLGKGLFFALGVFPYLWFMPETFKYSLTTMAIPVALLFACPKRGHFENIALLFGFLTLSLPGLDVVGPTIFFALQRASIPLVATCFLGAAVFRQAWMHSRARLSPKFRKIPQIPVHSLSPWPAMPRPAQSGTLSVLLPLPRQLESNLESSWVTRLLEETHAYFCSKNIPFEILVIPFGTRGSSESDPLWEKLTLLQNRLSAPGKTLQVLLAPQVSARGAALRDGFLASHGEFIASLNIEQPCGLDFYERALNTICKEKVRIVRANRRLGDTRFRIPVRHLSLVYGRHRMGLAFNRLVRLTLPIQTTDTHSGIWMMDRGAATQVFALQRFSGFLFELEAWLIAGAFGFKQEDLPLQLFLAQEKTPGRIGGEIWDIFRGLPLLALRFRKGYYHPQPFSQAITADDWGLTPGVNQGILQLAHLGIVRRVSLMAHSRFLKEGLAELQTIPGVELGLHFDLTYAKRSPGKVLIQALLPGLRRQEFLKTAKAELADQLQILNEAGVCPRYLDGHHHIHLIPGLLAALASQIQQAGVQQVRLPLDRGLWFSKPALILLSYWAKPVIKRHHWLPLPCFYPQMRDFHDPGFLRARMGRNPAAEVIVHPALTDDLPEFQIPDSYTSGRVTEFRALRMLEVR